MLTARRPRTSYRSRNARRTNRTSTRKLVAISDRLTGRIRRNLREEFCSFTFKAFIDVLPTFSSTTLPSSGYSAQFIITPAYAMTLMTQQQPQYTGLMQDYESYAMPYMTYTFIPHAQSLGSRVEGGGIIAMGIDPRGPPVSIANLSYNTEAIGKWAGSVVRPCNETYLRRVLNIKKATIDYKEPFWNKAGASPVSYPLTFPYMAFTYWRAAQTGGSMTDFSSTYVGTLQVSVRVYFKNRLARPE